MRFPFFFGGFNPEKLPSFPYLRPGMVLFSVAARGRGSDTLRFDFQDETALDTSIGPGGCGSP